MGVHTYTKAQHQPVTTPYRTVEKVKSKFVWEYKCVSPMELIRLLGHTEPEHQKLSLGERTILTVLLNHVKLEKVKREGLYEAYLR